ncbi:MAG: hypothetical protein HC822_25995 [Oscillochloris sp.]|nr:hypothetical protein [Oscillochloris sp.]
MVTVDQIRSYCERMIAEHYLSGNAEGLRETQLALGVLMHAAEAAQDKDTARQFRVLAAQAANRREELMPED